MFGNCIKYTSYIAEATQQRRMFNEKYRDAYEELEKRMDQSLGLKESSSCTTPPESKRSTLNTASSSNQGTRMSRRSTTNQKPQQQHKEKSLTDCRSVPKAASNKPNRPSTRKEKQQQCPQTETRLSQKYVANQKPQQHQKAYFFTKCEDVSKAKSSKRTSRSQQKQDCKDRSNSASSKRISKLSTKNEKQPQCPQIDSLSEYDDVCQPPPKNQDCRSQNKNRRLSKRLSIKSTLKANKSEKNPNVESPSKCSVVDSVSNQQNGRAEKPANDATCNPALKGCHIEDGYWEIEDVLKVRFQNGKMKWCLVRWKGYTSDDDSWEPANDLSNTACKSLFIY